MNSKKPIIQQSIEEQDKYIYKYLKRIADANYSHEKIIKVLDLVYQDGFSDGANSVSEEKE